MNNKNIILILFIVFLNTQNSFSQLNQYLRSILFEDFCAISILDEDNTEPHSVTFILKLNDYKNASYYLNNNNYFEKYIFDANKITIKNNWMVKEIKIFNHFFEEKVFNYFDEISKIDSIPYIHKTYTQNNKENYIIYDSINNKKYDLILKEISENHCIYSLKKEDEFLKTYDIKYDKSNKNLLVTTFNHNTLNFVKLVRKKNDAMSFLRIQNNEFTLIKKDLKYTETSNDKMNKGIIEYEIIHPNNKDIIWGNLTIQIEK